MPLTTQELLHPQLVLDVVSQVSTGRSGLAEHYKFTHDMAKTKSMGRYASYRIFNKTREPLTGRAPGTGPALIAPNPVGERQIACARFWDKIQLEVEKLSNISRIEGPNSAIDVGGQSYIKSQIEYLGQRINMVDAALTGGFLRGIFYLNQSGDHWNISYTAGTTYLTVDLQLPAGNKTQLDMLGAGNIIDMSWDNPAAPIVQHCLNVNDAMVSTTGQGLEEIMVTSVVWGHVINNLQVRTIGGTVQAPFDSFKWEDTKDDKYKKRGIAKATLKALPWITWIITDERVALGGGGDPVYSTGTATLTKVIADTAAVFQASPDSSWCELVLGSELVQEDYGKQPSLKTGFSTWSRWDIEPTACNLHALYNAVPIAKRFAWAYGTVVF